MEKAKILIVEDEAIIAMEIESSLQNLGYKTIAIVNTGDDAIKKAEEDKPDLILMDIRIKGEMDGIDAAEVVRNRFGIPVIFSTAYLDEKRIERAKLAMPFGYILKPIQERDLKVTIEMALYVAKADVERTTIENNLKESEEKFRNISEQSLMGIGIAQNNKFKYINQTYARIFGYPIEEMYNWEIEDAIKAIYPEDLEMALEQLTKKQKGDADIKIRYEYRGIKKTGEIIWIENYSKSIIFRDEPANLISIIDVTERKQAEEASSISEKKFADLANLLPQVVFETDKEGKLTFVNQYAFELFQYTHSDYEKELSALDMIAHEDQEKAVINMSRVLDGETLGGTEYIMQKRDGSKFPAIVHSTQIVHKGIPAGLRGIIIDITDRKKMERELRVSEKKYRQIFENAQTPYYEASLDGIILDVSPSVERYLKYKKEELIGKPILELYADSDQRDRFIEKLLENGELIDEEVLVRDKDGAILTCLLSSKYIPDEHKIVGSLLDITGRKRVEEKLMTSEKTFRSVVESSPMGIHMYHLESENRLVFVGANPAADRILEIDNSQFIGKTIEEAFPPLIETEIPNRYRLAAKEGISWQTEQIEYQDNEIKGAFEVHAFQMSPGNMATLFFDITERKSAEQALINSEERFRQLAENIKEVFWIVSPDWNEVYYVSPAFNEVWQIDEKELYHNALLWTDSIVKEDRRKVGDYLRQIQPEIQKGNLTEVIFPEYRISRTDGSEKWIFARGFPIYNENGQAYRVAGIAEDITERKKTQEIMIQTEKMMSVGGLAAGMAHEINNPLGGVLQGTQNVIRRLAPDLKANLDTAEETGINLQELQQYLEKRGILSILSGIRYSANKAAEIISNMLQFSRKSESNRAPTNLVRLLDRVLKMAVQDYDLEKKYDFKNIDIVKEFGTDIPLIPCTETEIEQVILNLLKNSAQAMEENGNHESPRITLRCYNDRNWASIEVEDNGPGMDESTRKRAFEPFFTTKPVGTGTGLGLSVSYMIITENHNGALEVESEPGQGTKFIIKLPLTRATNNDDKHNLINRTPSESGLI